MRGKYDLYILDLPEKNRWLQYVSVILPFLPSLSPSLPSFLSLSLHPFSFPPSLRLFISSALLPSIPSLSLLTLLPQSLQYSLLPSNHPSIYPSILLPSSLLPSLPPPSFPPSLPPASFLLSRLLPAAQPS